MGSILYLGDNDSIKTIFEKLTSSKGYESLVCFEKEELFYYLAFDRALKKKV